MKKFYLLKMHGISVLFLCFYTTSFAQTTLMVGASLNGEVVIDRASFDWGGDIVATPGNLYAMPPNGGGVLNEASSYGVIWQGKPPYKISHVQVKTVLKPLSPPDKPEYTKSDNRLIVTLDNGDVYTLLINFNETTGGDIELVRADSITNVDFAYSEEILKAKGDALFILTTQHLYAGADTTNWYVDSAGLGGAHMYDMDIDSAQRLYAATNKGLFVQDFEPGSIFKLDTYYPGPQSLASVFIDNKNRQFVCAAGGGVYKSDDGVTWAMDTLGIGGSVVQLFSEDAYGNVYAAAGSYLFKSSKGTGAWQRIDYGINSITVNPAVITSLAGDSILLVGTNFGSFVSADMGATWVLNNNGIKAENITGLVKTSAGLIIADALGIYNNPLGTNTWAKQYPQPGFEGHLHLYSDGKTNVYTVDNNIATTWQGGFIVKSADGGTTWLPDTTGLSGIGGSLFYVDETGTQHMGNTFYGGNYPCNLWAKPAGGTWVLDVAGFTPQPYTLTTAFASDQKGYLYVAGSFAAKVMRRAVTGGVWAVDTAGLPQTVGLSSMAGANGQVVALGNGKIYYRGNIGWVLVPLPVQLSYAYASFVSIDSSGYIFAYINALAGSGMYITADFGAHWKFAGLDSAALTSIVSYGDTTYVLTSNQGAFALPHNAGTLPVNLSTITAYPLGKGVQVAWHAYNEVGMRGYDVEKSADGAGFNQIGYVAAKNTGLQNNYTLFDPAPLNGDNFYRVKAISSNGTYQYSGVVKVAMQVKGDMVVYPNPVQNKTINAQLSNINAGVYTLTVTNAAGQRVYARVVNHAGGNAAVAINGNNMAAGVYWVVLKNAKTIYKKMVVVQ